MAWFALTFLASDSWEFGQLVGRQLPVMIAGSASTFLAEDWELLYEWKSDKGEALDRATTHLRSEHGALLDLPDHPGAPCGSHAHARNDTGDIIRLPGGTPRASADAPRLAGRPPGVVGTIRCDCLHIADTLSPHSLSPLACSAGLYILEPYGSADSRPIAHRYRSGVRASAATLSAPSSTASAVWESGRVA